MDGNGDSTSFKEEERVAGATGVGREPQVGFVASGVRFLIRPTVSLLPPRRPHSLRTNNSPHLAIKYLAEDIRTFVFPFFAVYLLT